MFVLYVEFDSALNENSTIYARKNVQVQTKNEGNCDFYFVFELFNQKI